MINFKDYHIQCTDKVLTNKAKYMVETMHYKHTARSLKPTYVFELFYEDLLVGVCIFGQPCSAGVERVYGKGVLELRRLVILNEAPTNTGSFFISKCLKQLKKLNVPKIVTYADPNEGHEGIVYKASNFKYIGVEKYRTPHLKVNRGPKIPVRMVYQKNRHTKQYVKSAIEYQNLMKEGKAKLVYEKPKHIYTYDLKGEQK